MVIIPNAFVQPDIRNVVQVARKQKEQPGLADDIEIGAAEAAIEVATVNTEGFRPVATAVGADDVLQQFRCGDSRGQGRFDPGGFARLFPGIGVDFSARFKATVDGLRGRATEQCLSFDLLVPSHHYFPFQSL